MISFELLYIFIIFNVFYLIKIFRHKGLNRIKKKRIFQYVYAIITECEGKTFAIL